MATRRPPGLRGSWEPSLPADVAAPTRPAEPWAHTRPHSDFQPTRPHTDFQHTRPHTDFQPTRPHTDFQHTRPLADFQPTRPMPQGKSARPDPWSHTQPAPLAAPTRPALVPGAAPAAPAAPAVLRRAPPPAPASPPAPAAPAAGQGHWQLAGGPGQNLVLMPGQMHLGLQVASLRTLLGSCVAITLWHPARRIGGMCHYLLPQRNRRHGEAPDGRYGDEAVEAMVKALTQLRTRPEEYVAHLYGGADTMSGVSAAKFNIGERNIEQGWALIEKYGFQLDGVDVGEDIPRMVSLSLADGLVQMRRGSGQAPDHLRG